MSLPCASVTGISNFTTSVVRRSGNYHPSLWTNDFIQSLNSDYVGETYHKRIQGFKVVVKKMLEQSKQVVEQLEMIDAMQRLGLAYHFEKEIGKALRTIYDQLRASKIPSDDLYVTALEFILLRQRGYRAPADVFNAFKEEKTGNFKAGLCVDIKGVLNLYEASFYSTEGETILEEACEFTTEILRKYVRECSSKGTYLHLIVSHALEFPTHWRMPRLEARWFIDAYETNPNKIPILLEFAKLDFNMVQAVYQEDLKRLSRWTDKGRLAKKLPFARNRTVECFFWSIAAKSEPEFGSFRRKLTKGGVFVTIMDDAFDVYATPDEIELLADAVNRWDINATDNLPDYAKTLFFAVCNFVNQVASKIQRDLGLHALPYLRKAWADLCKSYVVEANWYRERQTPPLKDYLENAWISIAIPILLVHCYHFVTNSSDKDISETMANYPEIILLSSMIVRLANDLGTSTHELDRGDNPKSIQCYMHESGASEEEARRHIHYLIKETWKRMNEARFDNTLLTETFVGIAMNVARAAQCIYRFGDGFGVEANLAETKNCITSLVVDPIPI